MPSKSKSQQRFFGMIDAYKKGELKNASKKIKKTAKEMSMSDVKDFAETKHKGLPEKVEERINNITASDLHRIVNESITSILREDDVYDELGDELRDAGAIGEATPEEIEGWEEDLWINVNKTLDNANYLFNKTRDERYAKIAEIIGNCLELFPEDADKRYMVIKYDPEEGYGG